MRLLHGIELHPEGPFGRAWHLLTLGVGEGDVPGDTAGMTAQQVELLLSVALVIGSALTRVSPEEEAVRAALHVIPEREKDPKERRKALKTAKWGCLLGVFMAAMLVILWVIPYYQGLRMAG